MGGFSNPVVGGDGELVRDRIKSDNYVAGTSGWDVEKTGQAEFQDVIARGDITATDVLVGDLPDSQVHIHGSAHLGVVEFLPNDSLGLLQSAKLNAVVNSDGAANEQGYLALNGPFFAPGGVLPGNGQAFVQLNSATHDGFASPSVEVIISENGIELIPVTATILGTTLKGVTAMDNADAASIQVGAGFAGKYYFEKINPSAQVIATGAAFNQLANLTGGLLTISDYGSAFNTGTGLWTCPVTGIYQFTMSMAFVAAAWVSGSRLLAGMTINGNTLALQFATFDLASTGGKTPPIVAEHPFVAGDVVRFYLGQVTGVNQTVLTGTEQSYITARRLI